MNLQQHRRIPYNKWWHDQVLARDKYTCQICGIVVIGVETHHKEPFSKDVNGRFNPENGISLCFLCHGKKHGRFEGFVRETGVKLNALRTVKMSILTGKVMKHLKKIREETKGRKFFEHNSLEIEIKKRARKINASISLKPAINNILKNIAKDNGRTKAKQIETLLFEALSEI